MSSPAGDIVICRDFEGDPLVRRVWSVAEDGILVCTEENFQRSLREKAPPIAVRVPSEAAYRYDQHLLDQLVQASQDHTNGKELSALLWKRAEHYSYCQDQG